MGVIEKTPAGDGAVARGGGLHGEDAHRVDFVVGVEGAVGALVVPVERHAVAVTGESAQALEWIVATGVIRGHCSFRHGAVGIAFAFVEAGRAHESERCSFGQVRAFLGEDGCTLPGRGLFDRRK